MTAPGAAPQASGPPPQASSERVLMLVAWAGGLVFLGLYVHRWATDARDALACILAACGATKETGGGDYRTAVLISIGITTLFWLLSRRVFTGALSMAALAVAAAPIEDRGLATGAHATAAAFLGLVALAALARRGGAREPAWQVAALVGLGAGLALPGVRTMIPDQQRVLEQVAHSLQDVIHPAMMSYYSRFRSFPAVAGSLEDAARYVEQRLPETDARETGVETIVTRLSGSPTVVLIQGFRHAYGLVVAAPGPLSGREILTARRDFVLTAP